MRNALEKYHRQSEDKAELKAAYENYRAQHEVQPETILSERIINAFSSFNIAPSGSKKRYLSVLPTRSDVEALQSDWSAVGEDLTLVLAGQILNRNRGDERKGKSEQTPIAPETLTD
ncbi:MAG: hypothetical protein D3916_03060 [Candidatus Electrothrix sp. MAN1_4]|nr:hypothetical protein [Candidatus Electrothrix sp. MAN1_4]